MEYNIVPFSQDQNDKNQKPFGDDISDIQHNDDDYNPYGNIMDDM